MEIKINFKNSKVSPFIISHPIMLDKGAYDEFHDIEFDISRTPDSFIELLKSSVPTLIMSTSTATSIQSPKVKTKTAIAEPSDTRYH